MGAGIARAQSAKTKRADSQRSARGVVPQGAGCSLASPIQKLQRAVGNRALSSLLRSRIIQPKLTVSHPDDASEREADRVADQVMRMPDPLSDRQIQNSPPRIQRVCHECEDELQRQPGPASREVARDLVQENRLRSTPPGRENTIQFQPAGLVIQRQPIPNVGVPTSEDRRQFIQDTINFFNNSAAFFRNPSVKMDRTIFDRVITNSYTAVVRQEETIDADLGGDADLKRRLRAAYVAAIRAVMSRATAALGQSEDDLYRENSGRIPMWAWQTAHHMERGITTPIAEGRTVNRRGNVSFVTNGFNVTIAPDGINRRLRAGARTSFSLSLGAPRFRNPGFDPPPRPTVRIQTVFGRRANAAVISGYGRGTTAEDIAGGAITPRSTSLGFHEGAHGLSYVEFLEKNPPPVFTGTARMTRSQFNAELRRWRRAWSDYGDALNNFSTAQVDCVGTTIDQFHLAGAAAGVRVNLECGP